MHVTFRSNNGDIVTIPHAHIDVAEYTRTSRHGNDVAKIRVLAAWDDLVALHGWHGYDVSIIDDNGDKRWSGIITTVRTKYKMSEWVSSLDDVATRVAVDYTPITGGVASGTASTDWATGYTGRYGILDARISTAQATLAQAEALRDRYLDTHAQPQIRVTDAMETPQPEAEIIASGRWYYTTRRYYDMPHGRNQYVSDGASTVYLGRDDDDDIIDIRWRCHNDSGADIEISSVWLRLSSHGTPTQDISLGVYDDSSGSMGVLLGSSTITASEVRLAQSDTWVIEPLSSAITVADDGYYWLRISVSSVDVDNYYTVATDPDAGYGATADKSSDGSTWTDATYDVIWRTTDAVDTATQLHEMLSSIDAWDDVLIDVQDETTGVEISRYRDGTLTVADYADEIMVSGTSSAEQMRVYEDASGVLHIDTVDDSETASMIIDIDRTITTPTGAAYDTAACPVDVWVAYDIGYASDFAQLSSRPYYVTASTYTPSDATLRIDTSEDTYDPTSQTGDGDNIITASSAITQSTGIAIVTHDGTLAVGALPMRVVNTDSDMWTITGVTASVGTTPEDGEIRVDVLVDGVSIFTSDSHKPRIVAGSYVGNSGTVDNPLWAAGSIMQVGVDSVGSTQPGEDLVVHVNFGVTVYAYSQTDYTYTISVSGEIPATVVPMRMVNTTGKTLTIRKVALSCDTAPLGSDIVADILIDGVSRIDSGNRPHIAAGGYYGETSNIDSPTWADGSYAQLDIVSVGSSNPGEDLSCYIICEVA